MQADLTDRIEILARWMLESEHLVVFTGAGISTDSGLSDFRGPEGIWTRREQGLVTEQGDFEVAEPNAGHTAITQLQRLGKLGFVISQNVDNLHLRSGIHSALLSELHGNLTRLRCPGCGFQMDNFDDLHACPLCRQEMVSSVVDFGQALPHEALEAAYEHARKSDLFIVAGSSLTVYPAADIPQAAVACGASLVIINQEETPLDHLSRLKFGERIGQVLPAAVSLLTEWVQA